MIKRPLMVSALATALSLPTGFALAADPQPAPAKAQTPEPEPIYGSQLMTQQERTEYRAKMSAAKTVGEQEQIRNEHHEQMKERAQARGVTLPTSRPLEGRHGTRWRRHGTRWRRYGTRWRRYGNGPKSRNG